MYFFKFANQITIINFSVEQQRQRTSHNPRKRNDGLRFKSPRSKRRNGPRTDPVHGDEHRQQRHRHVDRRQPALLLTRKAHCPAEHHIGGEERVTEDPQAVRARFRNEIGQKGTERRQTTDGERLRIIQKSQS